MRIQRLFLLFFFLLLLSYNIQAQVFVELRDNRYGIIGYRLKQHYSIQLEQSLFSQKPSTQYFDISLSYKESLSWLNYGGGAYAGSQWDGAYYDFGGRFWGNIVVKKYGTFDVIINPHYDSDYLFSFCYKLGTSIRINDAISFLAHYSTIPEYRMVENRVRVGFLFNNDHLQVSPIISYPLEGEPRTLRVLTSFIYTF